VDTVVFAGRSDAQVELLSRRSCHAAENFAVSLVIVSPSDGAHTLCVGGKCDFVTLYYKGGKDCDHQQTLQWTKTWPYCCPHHTHTRGR